MASQFGHFKIVKLLLKHKKVDVSAKNYESMRRALNQGHTEIVKILSEAEKTK